MLYAPLLYSQYRAGCVWGQFLVCLGYLSVTLFKQIFEDALWDINQAEFPELTFKSILEGRFVSVYFHAEQNPLATGWKIQSSISTLEI